MSWLFGYKSQQPQPPQDGQNYGGGVPGGAAGGSADGGGGGNESGGLTKAERKAMEAYRFDSSALERAAEAAKTLEKSSK